MRQPSKVKFISRIENINDTAAYMATDVVERQMLDLSNKVDTIHQVLEQLTEKVNRIALVQSNTPHQGLTATRSANVAPVSLHRQPDPSMMHKDILSDEPNLLEGDKSASASHVLSPEIQIQRLTAQLTAAYNRMAALEEQILACRFQ